MTRAAYNPSYANDPAVRGYRGGPTGTALDSYTNWANQPFNFEDFLGQLQGFSPEAFGALSGAAGGDYLTGNPYLDDTFQQASGQMTDAFNQSVLPNIASQFGGAGRTGGGLHHSAVGQAAGGLTDSLAGLSNQIYGGNYQMERDRQLAAAQGMYDMYNQGAGRHMQGLGLAGNLFSDAQNRSTQSSIANAANRTSMQQAQMNDDFRRLQQAQNMGLSSAQLGADIYGMQLGQQNNMMGLIPGFLQMGQQSNMQGINGLLQAGGLTEGYQGNALQDNINRWNFNQQAPWQNLGNYRDMMGGNWGATGTVTGSGSSQGQGTTTSRQRGGLFQDLLGAGLMAASFFPPTAPFAAPISAGLGASGNLGVGFGGGG